MIHLLTFLNVVIKVKNMQSIYEKVRNSKIQNRCNSFRFLRFIVSKRFFVFSLSTFCKNYQYFLYFDMSLSLRRHLRRNVKWLNVTLKTSKKTQTRILYQIKASLLIAIFLSTSNLTFKICFYQNNHWFEFVSYIERERKRF